MNSEIQKQLQAFREHFSKIERFSEVENIDEPIKYYRQIGGKNLRGLLVILSAQLLNRKAYKQSLDTAIAIELFHGFTLLHDDIMDKSSLRRGRETIHKKWNENIGILSGDFMLLKAYEILNRSVSSENSHQIFDIFTKSGLKVCEGQQLDIDNESKPEVSHEDYLECITLKTAELIKSSILIGGCLGGVSPPQMKILEKIGENFGRAFQLQDDFLDVFGDTQSTGKVVGNDILTQKKTIVTIIGKQKALEQGREKELSDLYQSLEKSPENVNKIRDLYKETGVDKDILQAIEMAYKQTVKGFEQLEGTGKELLQELILSFKKRLK